MTYQPAVVSLSTNTALLAAIEETVPAYGGCVIAVPRIDEFVAAVDRWFPVLAVLEVGAFAAADWSMAVRRCKVRPQTRAVPIYGCANSLDEELLQQTREVGIDVALSINRMLDELASIVSNHINPPTRSPDGWDDVLSAQARAGLALFNAGDYFEQHELLEEAWLAEERPIREMYQGILQIGVAFLQIERNNWAGALKMLRRGLPKLRGLPAVCQGVQIGAVRQTAERIHWEITQLGAARLTEFDRAQFPQIRFEEDTSSNGYPNS